MNTQNSISISKEEIFLEVKQTTLILISAILIPFLIHLIPIKNGVPAGALFLAMFYAPLIAFRFFKLRTAILISAISPAINYFIFGMPNLNSVLPITIELVLFTVLVNILSNVKKINLISPVLSFAFAKLFSTVLILSSFVFNLL